ncbi:hypothetical protein NLU13_9843 [Sarocladium strictum]|uniref:Uncharacterized protein n=1 Tax=Sarocladium strictum TaxID=5046 RepID=A0AA39G8Q8_SARSR|nr:hypothetical protein NLU13_9843 [Sarocladium strictum]
MALLVSAGLPALFVLGLYHLVIYPLLKSPLSKIPAAHWSTPFSPLWILLAKKQGYENQALLKAHRAYGPVIRVAPNAVSVDGPDAIRTVYVGGFEKDRWYDVFDNYGVPCMFSAQGSRQHSARKRMLANVYSKSYIHSSEAAKAQACSILYERLLPALDESASPALEPNGLDVHSLFLATATDFISAYVFGLKGGTNFIQDKGYRQHWLALYNSRNEHHFWPQEMPKLTSWLKACGIWLYPSWVDTANAELSDWNSKLCQRASISTSHEPSEGAADEAIVWNSLASGIEKEAKVNGEASLLYSTLLQQRDLSVASELFDHVLAGQETTGTTLTYLTWHLSKRSALQEKLRQELLTLTPNMLWQTGEDYKLPDSKQLDSLPLLHSIIMETLRLHAPIPGSQARRTPFPGSVVGGFNIPGGVRISGLAYTLHRDESVFPDALQWDHTRWLPSVATEEELRQRQRQFWAFSSGGRMCIGSNFAMHGM